MLRTPNTIRLSSAPDGYGFFYGYARRGDRTVRVDVLPPAHHWRGNVILVEPDPVLWLVLIDGQTVARCTTWDGVQLAIRDVLEVAL